MGLVGRDVTFLCGRAGVCGLGAAAAKLSGEEELLNYYLAQFRLVCFFSTLFLVHFFGFFSWLCHV